MGICYECLKNKEMVERKYVGGSRVYWACANKKCVRYYLEPEVIVNCGSHDSFSYRAGVNMARAQDERRQNQAASHMGDANEIYQHHDDLNIDAAWREDGYSPEQS
jgi:hypothetical protein